MTPALPDSNVWLALTLRGHRLHQGVMAWLSTRTSRGSVLFCRATQQAMLRLLTTAAVLNPYGNPPLSNAQAWEVYQSMRADPRIGFAHEPPDLEAAWSALALRPSASPKLWMDAYLAAFASAAGYRLVTIDTAFRQFGNLDLELLDRATPDERETR